MKCRSDHARFSNAHKSPVRYDLPNMTFDMGFIRASEAGSFVLRSASIIERNGSGAASE